MLEELEERCEEAGIEVVWEIVPDSDATEVGRKVCLRFLEQCDAFDERKKQRAMEGKE